jgi:hypothetical protein
LPLAEVRGSELAAAHRHCRAITIFSIFGSLDHLLRRLGAKPMTAVVTQRLPGEGRPKPLIFGETVHLTLPICDLENGRFMAFFQRDTGIPVNRESVMRQNCMRRFRRKAA